MTEGFGTLPSGAPVERVRIAGGGLVAHVLTLGAIVQDLRRDGVAYPLVLGADDLAPYLGPMQYFGATVGRFANRIGGGRVTLDGQEYRLPLNWRGRHMLHGGPEGASARLWTVEDLAPDAVAMSLVMEDGDMGFPGNLEVRLRLSLPGGGALQVGIEAVTDRATPCSFAHHSLFRLDDTGDLARHALRIDAARYLPVDADLIPTGEVAPVAGTRFDFRAPRMLDRVDVDHNFCLSDGAVAPRPVARLESRDSGLAMDIETDQPGLQVYTGAMIPQEGLPGHGGRHHGPFAGIALEAQAWPDAPNHLHFPDCILRPGGRYRQTTRYVFAPAG